MRTFVILGSFTEQGLRKLQETTERVRAFRRMAEEKGVTVREILWTRGAYDVVALLEAHDEQDVTALALAVDARGNVRTQTLRAFPMELMEEMLAKIAQADASLQAGQSARGAPGPA